MNKTPLSPKRQRGGGEKAKLSAFRLTSEITRMRLHFLMQTGQQIKPPEATEGPISANSIPVLYRLRRLGKIKNAASAMHYSHKPLISAGLHQF
jgi:hypothetical protein